MDQTSAAKCLAFRCGTEEILRMVRSPESVLDLIHGQEWVPSMVSAMHAVELRSPRLLLWQWQDEDLDPQVAMSGHPCLASPGQVRHDACRRVCGYQDE
jgi:hypothetical protein